MTEHDRPALAATTWWPRVLPPWLMLWLAAALIAIFEHGPMPMYSTRALSVAWEMWTRHSFVVPYLNGAPYSDKVPLLFWLIHLGWAIGGVGDVWPRVLEVALGATELQLCALLARRLFPQSSRVAVNAALMLMAFSYAFLFGLQIMYEVLLACCVLAALATLMPTPSTDAPRLRRFALAIALGLLAKGPVMLLHVAFPWLLGPLWNGWAQRNRRRWYGGGALAIVAACSVLLGWALWAASLGGEVYRQQLLFHQTAGRVVDAFAHAQPLWWYLPLLPALVFPFALWPRVWLALAALRRPLGPGLRFLACWLGPVLLGFSLVSGKQAYYLLPEYAGFALLLASAMERQREAPGTANRWLGPWPLALFTAAAGTFLLALPELVSRGAVHSAMLLSVSQHSPWFGALFLLLAIMLLPARRALPRVAIIGLLGALAMNTLFTLTWWRAYDVSGAAAVLHRAQARGVPVLNGESYDGQFHFLGRLTQPIDEAYGARNIHAWAQAHPDGLVVTYPKTRDEALATPSIYVQRFRGVWLAIRPASQLH